MNKWHPATKLLVLAALLALPYLFWTGGSEQTPVVAATVERAGPSEAELAAVEQPPTQFVLPPLEQFTAVVEHPLFSPSRRMPAPPPASEPDAPAPTPEAPIAEGPAEPGLRFFGTVRQGGTAAALVTYPATAEVARLKLGDMVGEWQVISVDRNRLELGLGEDRRSFEIFGAGVRQGSAESPSPVAGVVQNAEPATDPSVDEDLPEPE